MPPTQGCSSDHVAAIQWCIPNLRVVKLLKSNMQFHNSNEQATTITITKSKNIVYSRSTDFQLKFIFIHCFTYWIYIRSSIMMISFMQPGIRWVLCNEWIHDNNNRIQSVGAYRWHGCTKSILRFFVGSFFGSYLGEVSLSNSQTRTWHRGGVVRGPVKFEGK